MPEPGTDERKTPKGRIERDGQEAVKKPKVVAEAIEDLVQLKIKADSASGRLNDAIKACAEKSGYLAAAVRRIVVARSGEKFEEEKRKIGQTYELFDEVGED